MTEIRSSCSIWNPNEKSKKTDYGDKTEIQEKRKGPDGTLENVGLPRRMESSVKFDYSRDSYGVLDSVTVFRNGEFVTAFKINN